MGYSPARKGATVVGVIVGLVILYYLDQRREGRPPPADEAPPSLVETETEAPLPEADEPAEIVPVEEPVAPPTEPSEPGEDATAQKRRTAITRVDRPALPPDRAMQTLRIAFRNYGQRFHGNPVGNNAEITASLNGKNPGQVLFLGESPSLNDKGELVDAWGTPYFFHQLSSTDLDIRSAGADRTMWTADDLATR
jgi:hypothetical protein